MQNTYEPQEPSPFTRSRSVSVSSDVGRALQGTPPLVDPRPAFIAASAASQIVSVELEQNAMILGDGDNAIVSQGSLALLNGFLDYLLFNILASAKSTQLADLRPAIADVLKPRLAKEVVSAADEELSEYMGGDKEDEIQDFRGGQKPNGEFDLIRSWKLTRLRCMVYTRLGDLEEEEEGEYIALETLDESDDTPRRFSNHAGNITPAAAIFLTSIIEYLGEHALVLAGENAGNRLASFRNSANSADLDNVNLRVTVDENDMEKLALNPTLGRLWRTWKKRARTPTLSRTLSRESFSRRGFASGVSTSTLVDESIIRDPPHEDLTEEEHPQTHEPADIAIPVSDNDVNEIEIPGLWVDPEEVEAVQATVIEKVRRRSLQLTFSLRPSSETSAKPQSVTSSASHKRSQSLPVQRTAFPLATLEAFETTKDEESLQVEEKYSQTTHESEDSDETPAHIHLDAAQEEVVDSRAPSKAESLEVLERETQALKNSQKTSNINATSQQEEDDHATDGEVVEGQGTYQVPKLSSLPAQRPRRKSNRDLQQKEDPIATGYRDDHPLPTQGIAAMPPVNPSLMQQKTNFSEDKSRLHLSTQSQGATAPTSHPRQLDASAEGSAEDITNDRAHRALNGSRATSSLYTESIEVAHSISDDSEESVYRSRTPSYAASHAPSTTGQYRQNTGDNSPGRERAAVQRVILGSSTSQTSTKSRRSESISDRRPQTSGSATSTVSSKLKILIGRHPAENDIPLPGRPRRSSEASGSGEDLEEPTLDELIKSDETIRFTLTPRNMRAMELPASPRWNAPRNDLTQDRSGTADLAEFLKNTAPPGEQHSPRTPTDRTLPSPRVKSYTPLVNGLRAHPPEDNSAKSTPTSVHSPASPVSPGSDRGKSTMPQARDARTGHESVRDFAEFLRGTGPQGNTSVGTNRPSESSVRSHQRNGSTSVVTRPDTAQSGASRATARAGDSQSSPRKNGPRLQARDAAGNGGNKTSDLIDFIREGPPGASTHRIPPSINNEPSITASLASTRADSANYTGSINSLTSSRIPLLESNNRSDAPPPIPPKKRRGPRDPYAIDDSDDDLDALIETSKPSKPQRQEESMLDFLNSVPPPVSHKAPEPFILSSNPGPSKSSNGTSVLGLKGRFRRNTSVDKVPTLKKSMTSMRSAKFYAETSPAPPMPQVSSFVVKSGQPRTAAPLERPSRPTETSALADFLKNTGPPEPPVRVGTAMSEEKKDSTFSKIFRRKKFEF
ncbi:hypothetical protein BGW36DRAFT_372139 [Talaromyces proteolyticus]|uniref:Uncharacterized protein n=1 Tax=Talaromyces proteolyticus TaxID=1131652 RepID=A0AAD4Q3R2_9EURO|nr:uncharacterized protein BGW36DRAFT_372139 [Talaromyces proteolyticus]KAH8702068.1 hypothetical protein BGW36DRAFT_372139 [Talaromyces proteolyticus]